MTGETSTSLQSALVGDLSISAEQQTINLTGLEIRQHMQEEFENGVTAPEILDDAASFGPGMLESAAAELENLAAQEAASGQDFIPSIEGKDGSLVSRRLASGLLDNGESRLLELIK